jgi:GMP synthase (glutamine-hydrolysing)
MEKIIILDFGSQYTQLIARCIRANQVYCEIQPYNQPIEYNENLKGIVLSGSPFSVNQDDFLDWNLDEWIGKLPILAVCYGAQLIAKKLGGAVTKSSKREYGRATLSIVDASNRLFNSVAKESIVWMSHADTITQLPPDAKVLASTETIVNAAFSIDDKKIIGLQYHPEVYHSEAGKTMINNYLKTICGCSTEWTEAAFIQNTVKDLKEMIGTESVLMGLSGGVDSTVAAVLLHQAIGSQLTCVFVDNGLLRKNEFENVVEMVKRLQLKVIAVDAKNEFYEALNGISEPEQKRKAIGRTFIEVFDAQAKKMENIKWLGQGTIYPDVIESQSVLGPSATIKSHHNVGGLPEKMNLKIVEPLRKLFKDEVRLIGKELGIDDDFLMRHPFPGPGLGSYIGRNYPT